jgi:hypothetical protein
VVDPGLLGAGEGSELLEADGEPEVPGGLQGGRALLEDPGELALDLQDEDVLLVGAEGLVAGQVVEEEEGERDQGGDGLVLGFGRGGRKEEGMVWARTYRQGKSKGGEGACRVRRLRLPKGLRTSRTGGALPASGLTSQSRGHQEAWDKCNSKCSSRTGGAMDGGRKGERGVSGEAGRGGRFAWRGEREGGREGGRDGPRWSTPMTMRTTRETTRGKQKPERRAYLKVRRAASLGWCWKK